MVSNRMICFLAFASFTLGCAVQNSELAKVYKGSISWKNLHSNTAYQKSTAELRSNQIPDSVFKIQNLKLLSIIGMDCDYGPDSNCWAIRQIPPGIGNLKNLEALILNVNHIQSVPKEIKHLTNLRLLDLSDNPGLSDIEHVTVLPNLQNLILYGCGLTKLPRSISKMKSLRVLGLKGNHLTELEIERLRNKLPNCEIIW